MIYEADRLYTARASLRNRTRGGRVHAGLEWIPAAGDLEVRRFWHGRYHGKNCTENSKINFKGDKRNEERRIKRNYYTNFNTNERR